MGDVSSTEASSADGDSASEYIVEMALDEFFPADYRSEALPTWYKDIWGLMAWKTTLGMSFCHH